MKIFITFACLTASRIEIGFLGTIRDAANIFKVSELSISNCLNKRTKTAGGYEWEYLD